MHSLVYSFSVAAIDFDLLIGLFVILSVIGRLMTARKNNTDPKADPTSRSPQPPPSNPQAELEEFLKSLVGVPNIPGTLTTTQPRPAAAPPAPPPVRRPPPPQPKARNYNQRRQVSPDPRVQAKLRPPQTTAPSRKAIPIQPLKKQVQTASAPHQESRVHSPAFNQALRLRRSLTGDLTNKTSLRKAIVLRELLGPPLALR